MTADATAPAAETSLAVGVSECSPGGRKAAMVLIDLKSAQIAAAEAIDDDAALEPPRRARSAPAEDFLEALEAAEQRDSTRLHRVRTSPPQSGTASPLSSSSSARSTGSADSDASAADHEASAQDISSSRSMKKKKAKVANAKKKARRTKPDSVVRADTELKRPSALLADTELERAYHEHVMKYMARRYYYD